MSKKVEMPPLPNRMSAVREWCDKLRERRLNEEGRAAIDMLEMLVTNLLQAMESARGPAGRVTLLTKAAPSIEKQFRVALQADRAEADQETVRLRKALTAQREAEADLAQMH